MTIDGMIRLLQWLWFGMLTAGFAHYSMTEPTATMPVHGFNRLVILLGWFAAAALVAVALAVAAFWLPRDDTRRWLAVLPLAAQVLTILYFAVRIY